MKHCNSRFDADPELIEHHPSWRDWRAKLELGLERMIDCLWDVVDEFDVTAFGQGVYLAFNIRGAGIKGWETVLRYESIVREEEEERLAEEGITLGSRRTGKGKGKMAKDWDGRGAGVHGYGTAKEEDLWRRDLAAGLAEDVDPLADPPDTNVGHMVVYRFAKAECHKDQVSRFSLQAER
jgi:hypothetical protein